MRPEHDVCNVCLINASQHLRHAGTVVSATPGTMSIVAFGALAAVLWNGAAALGDQEERIALANQAAGINQAFYEVCWTMTIPVTLVQCSIARICMLTAAPCSCSVGDLRFRLCEPAQAVDCLRRCAKHVLLCLHRHAVKITHITNHVAAGAAGGRQGPISEQVPAGLEVEGASLHQRVPHCLQEVWRQQRHLHRHL